jgi:hypothetical protein
MSIITCAKLEKSKKAVFSLTICIVLLTACDSDKPRPAKPNPPIHGSPQPELSSDNLLPIRLGWGEAQIENLRIVRAEGYPQWVNILASGTLSHACQSIDEVRSGYDEQIFTVLLDLTPKVPNCDPLNKKFETLIPLQTTGLSAGLYTVAVHGINTEFELDVDQDSYY